MNLKRKNITVTGGNGFLGQHLTKELRARGYNNIFVPRSAEYDLRTFDGVQRMYDIAKPDVVIHVAANCGGIQLNKEIPGTLFYDNAMMGLLMMEEARKRGIEKFVQMGTCCAYPKYTPTPFHERDLWAGYPEETNAPYGIAKKAILVQGQAYRQQYGFNSIHLLVVNLYGPGDNTNQKHSHVIPALIGRIIEAQETGKNKVMIWGTGRASREFYYVEDAAKDIVSAVKYYDGAEPLNLGNGIEVTISEMAHMIAEKVGFTGKLEFNPEITDGQPHRAMCVDKAREAFGLCPSTDLDAGLDKTIEWYYRDVLKRES